MPIATRASGTPPQVRGHLKGARKTGVLVPTASVAIGTALERRSRALELIRGSMFLLLYYAAQAFSTFFQLHALP